MSKPAQSHMETYLKYLRASVQLKESSKPEVEDTVKAKDSSQIEDSLQVEAEYLRSIYKLLPREQALQMTVRQAKVHTSIRPH
ncbi:hypothetical protein [Endozoicomonas sp. 4G]|uniref:hypothetical protein n=1 Tax=Endozoicomonas sp. 4G TaxID=2872754 RepID=UPI002078E6AA|nr:hypothetical protein [Endozoicomonas sp. 4G]